MRIKNLEVFDPLLRRLPVGASPHTPEVFSGMTPVFNDRDMRLAPAARSAILEPLGETDPGSAEVQPGKG